MGAALLPGWSPNPTPQLDAAYAAVATLAGPRASFTDAGPAVLDAQGGYTATLPCLPGEGPAQGCQGGRITVRSPGSGALLPHRGRPLPGVVFGCVALRRRHGRSRPPRPRFVTSTPPRLVVGAEGITVTPPGDTPGVSTQLRLVDSPSAGRRGRAGRTGRRQVHWPAWKLDERARTIGRQGVAEARAALAQASLPDTKLSKAS